MILAMMGLLVACKGDKDDDSGGGEADADADADADTDTDTDADTDACTAVVTSVSPADDATGVTVDTVVLALFSESVDAATITVTTGSTTVSGTTTLQGDGSSATFTPKSDLDRDTTYDVDVAVCDSTSSTSFTTLPEGVAAADLEGKTYDFDLATAEWIEPTFGASLIEYFEANHVLIMVEDVDEAAETIDGLGAAGWRPDEKSAVEQYPCADAADFDPVPFPDNPAFAFGPDEFSLGDKSLDVEIHDAEMSGLFSADGSTVDDAHFEGLVDLRNVSAGEATACQFIELALGGDCVACPDGEVECLASTLEWASAPAVPGLTLVLEPSGKGC